MDPENHEPPARYMRTPHAQLISVTGPSGEFVFSEFVCERRRKFQSLAIWSSFAFYIHLVEGIRN